MTSESEQPEIPAEIPAWDDASTQRHYANVVGITSGPFDVVLHFGLQQTWPGGPDLPPVQELVRVAMSWGHAKSMIPLLAKMVADYESKFGEMPAPGFDQNWRA